MAKYEGYTVGLALFDYIPIALSALALTYIVKMIKRDANTELANFATLAVVLIISGGLCKATWKLLLSGFELNLMPLNNSLFLFLSCGFLVLAFVLLATQSKNTNLSKFNYIPILLVFISSAGAALIAVSSPESRFWVFYLIALTTLANTAVIFLLVRRALHQQQWLCAILLLVNLVGIFALSALSRLPDQTASLQWIEECCNAVAQGAFAYAAYQLYHGKKALG